ncbi:hypothetical protein D3C76_915640 [compost metagenome]
MIFDRVRKIQLHPSPGLRHAVPRISSFCRIREPTRILQRLLCIDVQVQLHHFAINSRHLAIQRQAGQQRVAKTLLSNTTSWGKGIGHHDTSLPQFNDRSCYNQLLSVKADHIANRQQLFTRDPICLVILFERARRVCFCNMYVFPDVLVNLIIFAFNIHRWVQLWHTKPKSGQHRRNVRYQNSPCMRCQPL